MYRKFALAIGVFAAVAVLAFVAAPLQAQTPSAVAPPTCSPHTSVEAFNCPFRSPAPRTCALHEVVWACNSPRPPRRGIIPDP